MNRRIIDIKGLLQKKSHFLFGARGTGKTTLIKEQLDESAFRIDLLNSDYYLRLASRPSEIEAIIKAQEHKLIAIDEVQKLPIILDEVHRLIEDKGYVFLLTGSSARKLKRGGANLLAGRAWIAELYPLVSREIPEFDLDRYLQFGGLPAVYYSEYPQEELKAYTQTYLTEEIAAEGLVRDLPLFSRFIKKSSFTNGMLLNFSELAGDLGVSPTTVREYYRILEDTLLGFMLDPYKPKNSRKEVSTSKFYFFDVGVANHLRKSGGSIPDSEYSGSLFEHFIIQEVRAALQYFNINSPLQFWRTRTKLELDLIVPNILALEIKSTRQTSPKMTKTLKQFSEEHPFKNYFLVSRDPVDKKEGKIDLLYYENFLRKLWDGDFF
jgi:predicted AAA+ superfamily ATPase